MILALAPSSLGAQIEIEIESGRLRGAVLDAEVGLSVFRGIPYAAAPVGRLRWRAPERAPAWDGLREALEFGPICPQSPFLANLEGLDLPASSEDCLNLNVWSTGTSSAQKQPVVVWIHGGGFVGGHANQAAHDGSAFARQGIVFVSIHYRLGPLGLLAHTALSQEAPAGFSGNYTIQDQLAALHWVQRNIAAFGGDPQRVTIMGESAGASSVMVLAASPLAKGLFRGAIAMSTYAAESTFLSLQEAEARGAELMSAWVKPDAQQALEVMRAIPADELWQKLGARYSPSIVLGSELLPRDPRAMFQDAEQNQVALLAGINTDEGTLFAEMLPYRTAEAFEEGLRYRYGAASEAIAALLPVTSANDLRERINQLLTADWFLSPTRAMLLGNALQGRPAWQYEFACKSKLRPDLGAYHGMGLAYALGNLPTQASASDRMLSKAMFERWAQFIESGNPNAKGQPEWPAYDLKGRAYLCLGDELSIKNGLLDELGDALELERTEKPAARSAATETALQGLPSAAQIMARHAQTTRASWLAKQSFSRHARGILEIQALGMRGDYQEWRRQPDAYLTHVELKGLGLIQRGVLDGQAWSLHPMEGSRLLTGREAVWEQLNASYAALGEPERSYASARVLRSISFEGVDCYELELVAKALPSEATPLSARLRTMREYYEIETGFKRGMQQALQSPAGEVQVLTISLNYTEFGGALLPTRIIQRAPGLEVVTTIETVEFDRVAPDVFDLPDQVLELFGE